MEPGLALFSLGGFSYRHLLYVTAELAEIAELSRKVLPDFYGLL
jgi:hypothetical protein